MIKTPLSTVIGGAFWTPGATILGSSSKNLTQLIKSLFSDGEQGFFYDPNDLSTMYQDAAGTIPVTAVGQPVGLIRDKSGRNNHAFQTVSASRPILQRNATTGAYYLAFDGVDDFLQTNSINFTATDKVSLFAGVRKLSDATRGVLVHTGSSTPSPGALGNFSLEAPSFEFKGYSATLPGASGNFDAKNSTATAPHSAVLSAKFWQSAPNISSSIQLKVNNILAPNFGGGAVLPGNFGKLPMYIGNRGGIGLPFNGHLYSLIGIGRLTTDSETIALEKHIAKNTGVTLSV